MTREGSTSEREQSTRDAIARARFFLEQARRCRYSDETDWKEPFEGYMEASLIFGRTAIHRLKASAERRAKSNPDLKAEWEEWWGSILDDPAILFFRKERDFILHNGPPKFHQNVGLTGPEAQKAEVYSYYESPDVPATATIERHLNAVEKLVTDAEARFGTSSLSGRWWEDYDG